MKPAHGLFFIALLFWQSAPMPRIEQDSTGRYHLSVAGGAGTWEDASFDCEGNFISSEPVDTRAVGMRFDADLSPALRATVAAGWSQRQGGEDVFYGQDLSGQAIAAQLAYEGRRFGLGMGITSNSVVLEQVAPNLYLRIGSRSGAHFRMDALEPTEMPTVDPVGRMGVGFGQGPARRTSGFVGLGFGPYFEQGSQTVGVASFAIPAGPVDVLLRGHAGPGIEVFQWAAGAGVRMHFR